MAAVRCAARRLGGSLLQRTQAAVAEEGRRLVPSRFMRSRQFASEGKKVEQAAQKKTELHDALLKARKNPKGEHDVQPLQHLHRRKVVPEPEDTEWQRGRFATRVNSVLEGLGRMAFYVGITALAVGVTNDKRVQA